MPRIHHNPPESGHEGAGLGLVAHGEEGLLVARGVEQEVEQRGLALARLADGGDDQLLVAGVLGELDHGDGQGGGQGHRLHRGPCELTGVEKQETSLYFHIL